MIEIITKQVNMPPFKELKYKKSKVNNKWLVFDTQQGGLDCKSGIVYVGNYIGSCLTCHNLNKKHYIEYPITSDNNDYLQDLRDIETSDEP